MSEQSMGSPRRPAEERADAFNVMAWLAEGAVGVVKELRHNDLGLPQEFWTHAYAARRESLLAARSFLEHLTTCTNQLARKQSERQAREEESGNINIDFGNS
ncbi:MAG: hypothetical protein R2911_13470 [Caldilineaceae bacterium]